MVSVMPSSLPDPRAYGEATARRPTGMLHMQLMFEPAPKGSHPLEDTMPAVTTDDLLVLPRVARPAATAVQRPVETTVRGRETFEGEGFPVRRPFPGKVALSVTAPFLLLDQMGAVEYAPGEPKGTPWHPHRGFETVTYIIDGAFEHQDSTGGGGLIADGATQWMTAGSGLLHIETPPEALVASGGLFHGVQLWGNLPAEQRGWGRGYESLEGAE